jgi:hypothetical protein
MSNVWENLLKGLNAAVELKVITYVGDTKVTADANSDVCKPELSLPSGDCQAMVTCLNLVQGDITNCIPKDFIKDENSWLRNYHASQVALGKEVVERNLKLIGDLGSKLATAIKEIKGIEGP